MKVLLTGGKGMLGRTIRRILGGRFEIIPTDLPKADITDPGVFSAVLAKHSPDAVIHCAAMTAVDKCETERELAYRLNERGSANVATACKAVGCRLLAISTDYVFDGKNYVPYIETDPARPKSVYGCTKFEGEKIVMSRADTAVIIRTSWLYSEYGSNFVKTMRRLGKERGMLKVIFDQVGTPTYAGDLAAAIVHILPQIRPGMKSIYHFSNEGVCSWYDFARAIIEMSGLSCDIRPIESWEYPSKAARPPYSVLNKAKIKKDFGIRIRHWRDALRECIDNLEENNL